MANNPYDPNSILAEFWPGCRPNATALAASSGLSGSKIWRVEATSGPLCLRRWPSEYPTSDRLFWIHEVLGRVFAAGFRLVPLPVGARGGESFIRADDHLWELTPWLAGYADNGSVDQPTDRSIENPPNRLLIPTHGPRIEAALQALAEFHLAAASSVSKSLERPPGLLKRLERLEVLAAGAVDQLALSIQANRNVWPDLADRSASYIELFRCAATSVTTTSRKASNGEIPIFPCIRDIHREHVLFQGNRVTGLIDFGAMQLDSPMADLARLLGSMAINDAALWDLGLAAYRQRRSLSEAEIRLVTAYDQTAMLLSGINWLTWVFADSCQFENPSAVLARFDANAIRLRRLANSRGPMAV